jgi:hypothetical protein
VRSGRARLFGSGELHLLRRAQAKLSALADYAAEVRDWPLLEEAIDAKITDWKEFVSAQLGRCSPATQVPRGRTFLANVGRHGKLTP